MVKSDPNCKSCGSNKKTSSKTAEVAKPKLGPLAGLFGGRKATIVEESSTTALTTFPKAKSLYEARAVAILLPVADLVTAPELAKLTAALVCILECNVLIDCDNIEAIYTQIDEFLCTALGLGFAFEITSSDCGDGETECAATMRTTECDSDPVDLVACNYDDAWLEVISAAALLLPGA